MKRTAFLFVLVASLLVTACGARGNTDTITRAEAEAIAANAVATALAQQAPAKPAVQPTDSGEPAKEEASSNMKLSTALAAPNELVNPELHHADSHAPEEGVGSFDIGVNSGQVGIVFGYHLAWPQGGLDAGGEGCDLVVLEPGWYENFEVTDGRYEVYDVPSSDYIGWVKVLVADATQGRVAEQAAHYGCPADTGHVLVWADTSEWTTWSDWTK